MIQDLVLKADIAALLPHSYKNFHTKGLDYLCLKRTEKHTVKVYFLDGDASKIPEVVNPHNHRYPFQTTVLRGAMVDHRFMESPLGDVYQAFDYMTPLNGGNGFTYRREERLFRYSSRPLARKSVLFSNPSHRHTISMRADQTILLLEQFEDVMPLDAPTSCWVLKGEPAPDTSGLYERFTEGQFADRLALLKNVLGL